MNKRNFGLLGFAALAALGFGLGRFAQRAGADGIAAETPMVYAGVLEEGGALVSGERMVRLVLWDHATDSASANKKCETFPLEKTVVTQGQFRLPLDNSCTTAVHDNPNLFVELYVEGESMGRSKLGAVPYALEAGRAAAASGALKTDIAALGTNIAAVNANVTALDTKLEAELPETRVLKHPTTGKRTTILGSYCGKSAPKDGNLGGYAAVKTLCETTCGSPTAHQCSNQEAQVEVSLGAPLPEGWYSTGLVASTTWDCGGWTVNTSPNAGAFWSTNQRPSTADCSGTKPVLCCD